MKTRLFFLFLLIFSLNSFAQISFEKGYYINNSDQKIECFIKNVDWKKNPKEFSYKLTLDAKEQTAGMASVKEFGINDIVKYVRHTVDIDRSSKVLGQMSRVKEAIFKKEQLFLELLVEGKANLYKYADNNLTRFFYKIENSIVDQLIHKKYRTKEGNVATNNIFRQQLLNDMRCGEVSISDFQKINYNENKLIAFFVKYNECNNSRYTRYRKKEDKGNAFHISVRPGLKNSSLEIQSLYRAFSNRDTDFGSKIGFRIGIEFEYVLPFNKNKWSLLFEPTYQSYEAEEELIDLPTSTIPIDDKITVSYSSIELPIGVRHYMFLNNKSKFFVNAAIAFDISSSKIEFERLTDLKVKGNANFAFGAGYKYNDRYSLEIRYATSRDIVSTQYGWESDYKTIALIFGYTLF